jgi:hypothetical protein
MSLNLKPRQPRLCMHEGPRGQCALPMGHRIAHADKTVAEIVRQNAEKAAMALAMTRRGSEYFTEPCVPTDQDRAFVDALTDHILYMAEGGFL